MRRISFLISGAVICVALLSAPIAAWADTVTLRWDPSPDGSVTGYYVYVGTEPGVYATRYDVGNTTGFAYGDGVAGQRYYFAVAAYSPDSLLSSLTNEVSWLPDNTPDVTPDVTPPVVEITMPDSDTRLVTEVTYLTLGGTATAGDDNPVVRVQWVNDRGGSGSATGTATWIAAILLYPGRNDIHVTAIDAAGNVGTAEISMYRQ